MMITGTLYNETLAAKGFSNQSAVFDSLYGEDTITQYKRARVRRHISRFLAPQSQLLELNAGTGEDALYFAKQGHTVYATDVSEGMIDRLYRKTIAARLEDRIGIQRCSYTQLHQLAHKGPFDAIFSNFAGFNCCGELEKVFTALPDLVKPGGTLTMVLLPPFCLWETLLAFKGYFKTAVRRWSGRKGRLAHVAGEHFHCYYYRPSWVISQLRQDFEVLSLEGLCTIVPPSYIQGFAEKHPALYRFLCRLENRFCGYRPWRYTGDYYILSLRRKEAIR